MAPEKLREEDIAIGQRIKNRRIEIGMTQEELAQRVGYAHKFSMFLASYGTIKCNKKATRKLRDYAGRKNFYIFRNIPIDIFRNMCYT